MRPPGELRTATARRFVKLAILIAIVPTIAGCVRSQAATAAPPGFQPIAAHSVEFAYPHKGGNLPLEVRVDTSPAGSVGFNVYTDQQWREMSAGQAAVAPVGLGTPLPDEPGALVWQGTSPDAGIYHVQVFARSQPASFKIAVAGAGAGGSTLGATNTIAITSPDADTGSAGGQSGVSLPATPGGLSLPGSRDKSRALPARKPAAVATARPSATAAPTARPDPTRAELALTGMGNFNAISDQAMEFVFYYPGGNEPVDVLLGARPAGSVGFSVYTDQQWDLFAGGDLAVAPIGRGTPNPSEPGSLFWRGVSASPGLYHVRVFRQSQPASFWIALAGRGAGALYARSPSVPQP